MFAENLFKEESLKSVEATPMVLLSAVDHYKRQCYKRAIGILLGEETEHKYVVTNSFGIPFEENSEGYFLDTSYLQLMFELFHKVNSKEKILGWYHTGPKMYQNDREITKTLSIYCENPILGIINVHLQTEDIPLQAYLLNADKELVNLSVQIGADDNEEVGVEHLLRDIKEGTGTTLKDKFNIVVNSLEQFDGCLTNIIDFLEKDGPKSSEILKMLQEISGEIPRLDEDVDMMEVYNCELVNCLVSMNELLTNKKENALK